MNEQEKYDWMVYVSCMTYNHAPYIDDAMNGFTMQETTFPYVCCIVDDASTDGEQTVIKNYLNEHFNLEDKGIARHEETDDFYLTFARHRINLNCYFAVFLLKYNHYKKKSKAPYLAEWRDNAKYMTICEGDDYWINSQKLQMQVDFLESNIDYSMCFHNAFILNTRNNSATIFSHHQNGYLTEHEAIHEWVVPTASIMYLNEIKKDPEWVIKIYSSDYTTILKSLAAGKIYGFGQPMSVYRQNWAGSSVSAQMQSHKRVHYEDHKKLLESFNRGTNYRFDEEIRSRIKYLDTQIKFYTIKESGKWWEYISILPVFLKKSKKKIKLAIKKWLFPEY